LTKLSKKLTEVNSSDFNYLKLLEELSELTNALIEWKTKNTNLSNIIEEIGDLKIRLTQFKFEHNIKKEVQERVVYKTKYLLDKSKNKLFGKKIELK